MSASAADAIASWLKKNPLTLRSRRDGDSFTLIESATGKQIAFDAGTVSQCRFTPHPQGLNDYLNLVFENGTEIVLCHAGIAFSPSFVSTGPFSDAPPVSCMTDYVTLSRNLQDITADPQRKAESLLLFNVLISILDGAKAIGMDVGLEEEDLERKLSAFEKNVS